MTIDAGAVLERSPERNHRTYLKGVVIEPGLALNESAADLYLKLDGEHTLEQLCTDLRSTYDAELDVLVQDAIAVCSELLEEGAVRVVGRA
ncbi:PqqD family protein [Streptomyces sp. NPDC017435]|uniref:PqqD family protein n=1 Tax=Streptomyces sp. NPDC017435 TaxID=3364995 RepID=UPI0037A4C4D2